MFTDSRVPDVNAPVLYYRLKQVDYNGKFVYSNVAQVKMVNNGSVTIDKLSPNPFASSLTVNYNLPDNGSVLISIIDAQGRILESREAISMKGQNIMKFNTAALAKGMYFITVKYNGSNTNYKMLVKE
jgi:hypothetical protein